MHFPIAFFNGQYLPKQEISISPDDRGFLFGDGTYEVVRIYHGKPFRLHRHIERLRYSTEAIRIPFSNFNQIEELAYTLIQKNELPHGEAMLYIQITRGVSPRSHSPNKEKKVSGPFLFRTCDGKDATSNPFRFWPMYWPVKRPLNGMPMKPFLCEMDGLPKEPIPMCAE